MLLILTVSFTRSPARTCDGAVTEIEIGPATETVSGPDALGLDGQAERSGAIRTRVPIVITLRIT